MAEFYDDPATGKLWLRGAAGGGSSEYHGPASETDIRNHPDAYRSYTDTKQAVADRVRRAAEAIVELNAEEAVIEEKIAEAKTIAEHPAETEEK
jgi:hypothetical protein